MGWSPVLTTEDIHSLLSSTRWVCPTLAQIPLQLPSFTGATLLSTGLLGQWIGHTGSSPSLTASISPSLLSLRGLCSPLGNASKQNPSPFWSRTSVANHQLPPWLWFSCIKDDAIQMFPSPLLQHLLLAKGSWEVEIAMPMHTHSSDQHIWWPSSQVNYRGIRHCGRCFLSVWSYLSIWGGWDSWVVMSACSSVAMRLQSHMPRDLGFQVSFPSWVTLLKSNPKHTENLKDNHKEPNKDIFTLFPKARKENIFPQKSLI